MLNFDGEHNSYLSESLSSVAKPFNIRSDIGLLSMHSNSAIAKAIASHIDWNVNGFFSNNPAFYAIVESIYNELHLRGNGTPPLFDVLPFEINNENYFLFIGIVCTIFVLFLITFRVAQLVGG